MYNAIPATAVLSLSPEIQPMLTSCRLVLCAIISATVLMPSGVSVEPTGTATRSFDTDPQWDGFRNRLLPDSLPIIRQNFGYRPLCCCSTSLHADRVGGIIQRAHRRAYYASPITPLTLQDRLTASGRFSVHRADGASGVLIGWFNSKTSEGWRTPDSLGFRIDGNGDKFWVFYEYGTSNRATGGAGAFDGLRYQTTTTNPFAADGTEHQWTLTYDPNQVAGRGLITLTIDRQTWSVPLHPGHKELGATFDRFGIWNQQTPGDSMELYISDLMHNGSRCDLQPGGQWDRLNNVSQHQPQLVRPFHEFGYSDTSFAGGSSGEIGGVIFRDRQPAYYADRTTPLTLNSELTASGRVVLRSAGADSAVLLGWFDHQRKQDKQTPDHEVPQTDYLGILIEGPSRVGHYFRPAYATSTGNHDAPTLEGTLQSRPVIIPGNQVHHWSLHYQPEAANGRGRIRVTFDGQPHELDLNADAQAEGATFDRFGLFNIQSGGHHVELYLDDLSYSR